MFFCVSKFTITKLDILFQKLILNKKIFLTVIKIVNIAVSFLTISITTDPELLFNLYFGINV